MRKTISLSLFFASLTVLFLLTPPYALLASPFAYITNSNDDSVSVIDTATNTVTATIAVGNNPYGAAVNPAGTRVYVTNNDGIVSVIDTATNTVIVSISVGLGPYGVAVNPVGNTVYVASQNEDTVTVIDTATNTVSATVPVGNNPYGVAVNPAGTRVFVTNYGDGTLSVIDTTSNNVIATLPVGIHPLGVAVNPAGIRIFAANSGSNTVSVVDSGTNTLLAHVAVGAGPFAFGNFIGPEMPVPVHEIQFTGLTATLAGTPHPGDPIPVTATTLNPGRLYYKFWYRAGYGTPAYDTNPWEVMQNYTLSNTCTYVFPGAGHYIIVVWAVSDPANVSPNNVTIIGADITVQPR